MAGLERSTGKNIGNLEIKIYLRETWLFISDVAPNYRFYTCSVCIRVLLVISEMSQYNKCTVKPV